MHVCIKIKSQLHEDRIGWIGIGIGTRAEQELHFAKSKLRAPLAEQLLDAIGCTKG